MTGVKIFGRVRYFTFYDFDHIDFGTHPLPEIKRVGR
jgi:hypothetical protein